MGMRRRAKKLRLGQQVFRYYELMSYVFFAIQNLLCEGVMLAMELAVGATSYS